MTCKLGFTVAVMVGLVFSAPSQAADEVVLGLSFGKTGLYSTINKTTEVAVDIAVEEINAAGGVNGKKLRIVNLTQLVTLSKQWLQCVNLLVMITPWA